LHLDSAIELTIRLADLQRAFVTRNSAPPNRRSVMTPVNRFGRRHGGNAMTIQMPEHLQEKSRPALDAGWKPAFRPRRQQKDAGVTSASSRSETALDTRAATDLDLEFQVVCCFSLLGLTLSLVLLTLFGIDIGTLLSFAG
jgi:hypothetical protein